MGFRLLGRAVLRGGEKVSAEEVQDHVGTHPAVGAVAVVAVPHPTLAAIISPDRRAGVR